MLRRRLQQLSCILNAVTFSLLLSLVLAHTLVRRYLPHVSHGKENFDFFFEGEQESDDQHHPPFIIDWRVVMGTILAFLVSCAVDVGGLAGGGLLVPIFYQVVGFGLVSSGQAVWLYHGLTAQYLLSGDSVQASGLINQPLSRCCCRGCLIFSSR